MDSPESKPVSVSIIVPTYCEAENLPLLVKRVADAFKARGWLWEIIVVDDDSPDGTEQTLSALRADYPQVRFLIRRDDRGLSSAVLAGFDLARFDYLVVMDADLSHPPEMAPALVDPLLQNRADFVIGSRNVPGGRTESWGIFRWLNSAVATALCRPLVGQVRDSMAGFFALRRPLLATCDALNPIGYKIGLELIVKARVRRIVEVPIVFRNRTHGKSKLTLAEQFRYLEHLSRLYDYRFPRGSPRVKFLIVCACGAAVSLGGMALLVQWAQVGFIPALAMGLAAMILVTLLFFVRYVRTQRQFIRMKHPYLEFSLISLGEWCAGLLTGWAAHRVCGIPTSALCAIGSLVLVRYGLRKLLLHDVRGIRGQRLAPATRSGSPEKSPSALRSS